MAISLKRLLGRAQAGDVIAVLIFAVLAVIGMMLIADGLWLKAHETDGFMSPAHMLVDFRPRPHG
jgi:hypothetical protein